MAIESLEQETQLLLKAVAEFRAEYLKTGYLGKLAPYEHIKIREDIPFHLFMYHEMLKEHTQALANEINHFCLSLTQLNAWDNVLKQYDFEEKHILLMEFIENTAIVSTNYPAVIRARFIFSVSHLSHQANRIMNHAWKEKELPPDRQISWNTMKHVATAWPQFAHFLLELERLANKDHVQETSQFRDKYHHRYPPQFVLGHTGPVARIISKGGRVQYGLGYHEPLQFADLLPILTQQHRIALICFERYSDLLKEQLIEIYKTIN